jgi:hypothetical protein
MIKQEATLNSWNKIIAYWNHNAAAVSGFVVSFRTQNGAGTCLYNKMASTYDFNAE